MIAEVLNLINKTTCILILFLLNACNYPRPGQAYLSPTAESAIVERTETEISSQDYVYSECAFVWASMPLPELSNEFDQALKVVQPEANGYAEAYGENCINNQGEVVRFLAKETDFHTMLKVDDLENKQALGKLAKQVMEVLAGFPVNETPGPQPGYIGITFEAPGDELRLWFAQTDAEAALDKGLRGEEFFNALQAK